MSRPFFHPILPPPSLPCVYAYTHGWGTCTWARNFDIESTEEARRNFEFPGLPSEGVLRFSFFCKHRCAPVQSRCERRYVLYLVRHPLGDLTVNLDRPFSFRKITVEWKPDSMTSVLSIIKPSFLMYPALSNFLDEYTL